MKLRALPYVLLLPCLAAGAMLASGCSPRHSTSADASGTEDPAARRADDLARENEKLQRDLETTRLMLELVTLARDEYKLQAQNYRNDLEYAEQQFIRVESQIRKTETRADAITATAEARIILEQARSQGRITEDSKIWREATEKLGDAEQQLKRGNYGGAVFFAQRTVRLLEQAERQTELGLGTDEFWQTTKAGVNFRSGPGRDHGVLRTLNSGEILLFIKEENSWLKARTSVDRLEGWVHRSLVERLKQ